MLGAVDPAAGLSASTGIILLRNCGYRWASVHYLVTNRPSVLNLTTSRGCFAYLAGRASSDPRARDQPACGPSGDHLIANNRKAGPTSARQSRWRSYHRAGPERALFSRQARTRSGTISFPLVSGPRYSAKHQLPPPIRQPINIGIENPRS